MRLDLEREQQQESKQPSVKPQIIQPSERNRLKKKPDKLKTEEVAKVDDDVKATETDELSKNDTPRGNCYN